MAFSLQRLVFETLMITFAWVGLFTLIAMLGYPIFWLIKKARPDFDDIPDLFWLGFTGLIAFLQIWHLFLPVNWILLFLLVGLDIILLVYLLRQRLLSVRKMRWPELGAILVITVLAVVLANQALVISGPWGSIVRFDMGNYHVQAVQWLQSFPIIPGLGNINYRLAYNNSIFLFDALVGSGYWDGRAYYIASGIIIFAGIIQSLFGLKNLLTQREPFEIKNSYFAFMLVPILFKTNLINSLEPDACIFVMSLVLAGQLIALYDKGKSDASSIRFRLFIIACLSSIGITVKLSFFGLGVTAFGLACVLARLIFNKKNILSVSAFVLSILSWLLVVVTWLVRSVILGGYLAFPLVATQVPVSWRVPASAAIGEYQWIKIFARTNDPASTDAVLSNLDWLTSWMHRIPTEIIIAGGFLIFGIVTFSYLRILKKGTTKYSEILLAGLPFVCSLVFWFINAPDIRFADGSVWAISLLFCTFCYGNWFINFEQNKFFFRLTPLLVTALLIFFAWPVINLRLIMPGPVLTVGIHHLGVTKYHEETTSSGLKVNVPDDSLGRCWNVPLPCMPAFDSELSQVGLWPGRPAYQTSQ